MVKVGKKVSLYIMCGIVGSGKTTQAKRLAKENKAIIVSKDDIRTMINGEYRYDEELECIVKAVAYSAILTGLKSGYSVIVDETNIRRVNRLQLIETAKLLRVTPIIIYCKGDGNNLENRMKEPRGYLRGKWEKIIEDMQANFEEPIEDLECEVIVV